MAEMTGKKQHLVSKEKQIHNKAESGAFNTYFTPSACSNPSFVVIYSSDEMPALLTLLKKISMLLNLADKCNFT